MRILLSLLLCVYVTARVVPAVSGSVPDLLLVQNAKVQSGTQQPTKPLLTTSTGSSKIEMCKSEHAIQYSYIITAVTGTTMAKLNMTIAQVDKQQKAAFAKETNAKVKSYFKSKTKSGYGGMLSAWQGWGLPYFAGYYLDSVVQELAKNPQIKAIVQDFGGIANMNTQTERNVPWHLYKLSAFTNHINDDVNFPGEALDYRYVYTAGEGVPIYIVDKFWGISQDRRYKYQPRVLSQRASESNQKLHGEKVAAFAARKDVGVAKRAQIVMVDRGVSFEGAIGAINQAVRDYLTNMAYYSKGAVINLSFLLNRILRYSLVRENIDYYLRQFPLLTFVLAAGGVNVNSCTYDLNLSQEAIKVSALNQLLELAPGFPYGRCVDILAPGVYLEYEGQRISGTSYSAPIVSGLAAYFYSVAPIMNSQYLVSILNMKKMIKRCAMKATLAPGELDRGTPLLVARNGIEYFH